MPIRGASIPNRFVEVKTGADDAMYVVLYWRHNYLEMPLPVTETGRYVATVRAVDCPPVPLRIHVEIGEESKLLVWDEGDYTWRDKSFTVNLPRGIVKLRVSYLTPPNNRLQNASIDYIELERVGEP